MGKLTPEQAAKNRERQRRWRERAFKDPDGHGLTRVNLALSAYAAAALKRLAQGYGLTQRELCEWLLSAADAEISATLDYKRLAAYLDGKLDVGALGAFDLTVRREGPLVTPPTSRPAQRGVGEGVARGELLAVDDGPSTAGQHLPRHGRSIGRKRANCL